MSTTTSTGVPLPQLDVTITDAGLTYTPTGGDAGQWNVTITDARTNPTDNAGMGIWIEPGIINIPVLGTGANQVVLLCSHEWWLRLYTSSQGFIGPYLPFDVGGSSSLCTTPIT
jgi:hypothetical protein